MIQQLVNGAVAFEIAQVNALIAAFGGGGAELVKVILLAPAAVFGVMLFDLILRAWR
jgi:hypothetical protein